MLPSKVRSGKVWLVTLLIALLLLAFSLSACGVVLGGTPINHPNAAQTKN